MSKWTYLKHKLGKMVGKPIVGKNKLLEGLGNPSTWEAKRKALEEEYKNPWQPKK